METLEALARRIGSTGELRSIVRTMKALSAVSIRQYDQATAALADYAHGIELGLQVVLRAAPMAAPAPSGMTLAVVFGSEHGLCGRFNHQIARFARIATERAAPAEGEVRFLAVGARVVGQLEADGLGVAEAFPLPSSADGLSLTVRALLLRIEALRAAGGLGRVLVFHNHRAGRASAAPRRVQLVPLDRRWQEDLAARRWPSPALPSFSMEPAALLTALVGQHLFVELFRAAAESAASEHATRLAAMQAAERNIDDRLADLRSLHRRRRQDSITEEMLDVVAGFEVLRAGRAATRG